MLFAAAAFISRRRYFCFRFAGYHDIAVCIISRFSLIRRHCQPPPPAPLPFRSIFSVIFAAAAAIAAALFVFYVFSRRYA
jgi:hypothetical protein